MLIRKLYNNGQIIIPKKVTQKLGIEDGQVLYIYNEKDTIVIEKDHENKYLNQATLNNGNLTIPCELRKLLNWEGENSLEMEVSSNNKIHLKKI
ncbi:AbrB/MazE/SpoVT family DNA-binding domain-containing protein [Bacillus sp. ISL-39]|uniref:AbrB/MazE/SpoVT family DNA-binding domain-containing protein n=1 Tax=Bacillus sp. ISL-39 TaxID=2819124 RepID=UPI001BE7AA2D|nr:AbrB/MazE/SpoVT family DNA-binding domain-containing protein [Bacillus sp. ISL-39]MBT2639425.1 AbrB/MazE/SpoVT family DNA-binding domain-containing protein [Bacillus sp. ISL-39]